MAIATLESVVVHVGKCGGDFPTWQQPLGNVIVFLIILNPEFKSLMQVFDVELYYRQGSGSYKRIYSNLTGDYGKIEATRDGTLYGKKIVWKPLDSNLKELKGQTQFKVKAKVTNPFSTPEMVYIKGGTFQMGSNDGDSDEKPIHRVTLSDFYIGKYEVTNEQFCAFLNDYGSDHVKSGEYSGQSMMKFSGSWNNEKCRIYKNGSTYKVESGYNNYAVIYVTWYGANEYCNWLSKQTGEKYSLPTEAQWEYAAGNGSKHTTYSWGNGNPSGKNGGNVADETAKKTFDSWTILEGYTDGYVYVAPVGQFNPNEFGLYDMSGNVWEWCNDWYGDYSSSSQTNPTGASTGARRVRRGGGWGSGAHSRRVADRYHISPSYSYNDIGFRVCKGY